MKGFRVGRWDGVGVSSRKGKELGKSWVCAVLKAPYCTALIVLSNLHSPPPRVTFSMLMKKK